MKGLTIVLFLVASSTQVFSQDSVAGRLFWKSHPEPEVFSAFAEIPPPVGAIQDAATACASPNNGTLKSFCNDNVDVCASTGVNLCLSTPITINCTGSTPYCVQSSTTAGDAVCSSEIGKDTNGTDCPAKSAVFDCTQIGVVPDPMNCKRYYYCYKTLPNDTVIKAEGYECPNLHAFDPSLPDSAPCRFTNNNAAYCIKSNCLAGETGIKILKYPFLSAAQGQIGVRCLGEEALPPLIVKCGAYSTLSGSTFIPNCVVTCRALNQKAPYNKDNTKYYQCYRAAVGYTAVLQSCFPGYIFDSKKLDCVYRG